jgi:putative DNA primase/helicase
MGLFLTEDWPELIGAPTRDEALAALEVLLDPFSQFPFSTDEDKAVLVSAIPTVLQRRLLQSAPLFGFSAPTPRAGKSLLAECVAIIATGRPAPAMAVSNDKEEIRKAVAAALREGHSIVNLDNIEHPLGSPNLSRTTTQSEYQDRILGESRMLRLPTNITWTATGNRLSFKGDLAVRVVVCKLDAGMERPEGPSFEIPNLRVYTAEQRRELVNAALLILRAYVLAGSPDQQLVPRGGFDEWSAVIRAPLVWLGMAEPCDTRMHVIEEDPEREQAVALLGAWHSAVGGETVQSAYIVKCAEFHEELQSALLAVAVERNNPSRIDPRRLGHFCWEWENPIVSGFTLRRCGKSHQAVT